ncbi:hypothetical protein B0T26DRAFT_683470 [Lasiosphaeria miniovina]|uniref:Uncharacterized protein n=1 Tax=Lasiosphaeria miniovina TaxID=1954250 RepID=A0AA40BFJ8_9PEZI|nr:uncharacterized protein B0T26DRAFT_683470 [Lasiosphaeria miniovina]KAK0733305.1 hypothetical protein B0T26DRAFT_683470 [Lasiosphaeria miniovina]
MQRSTEVPQQPMVVDASRPPCDGMGNQLFILEARCADTHHSSLIYLVDVFAYPTLITLFQRLGVGVPVAMACGSYLIPGSDMFRYVHGKV